MNGIYLLFSILLLSGAAIIACAIPGFQTNQSVIEARNAKTDITGKIIKANRAADNSGNGDFLGSIYVEGSGNYDRAAINVKSETRIFVLKNKQKRAGNFSDLKVGSTVQATFSGPVLESYPVQATASEIVVLTDDKNDETSNAPIK